MNVALDTNACLELRGLALDLLSKTRATLDSSIAKLLDCASEPKLHPHLHSTIASCVTQNRLYDHINSAHYTTLPVGFIISHLSLHEQAESVGLKRFIYRVTINDVRHSPVAIQLLMRYLSLSSLDQLLLCAAILYNWNYDDVVCSLIEVLSHRAPATLFLALCLVHRANALTRDTSQAAYLMLIRAVERIGRYRNLCLSNIDFLPWLEIESDLVARSTLGLMLDNVACFRFDRYLLSLSALSGHQDPGIRSKATKLLMYTLWHFWLSFNFHLLPVQGR